MHGRIESYAYIGSNQVVHAPDGNGPIKISLVKTKTRTKSCFKIRGKEDGNWWPHHDLHAIGALV